MTLPSGAGAASKRTRRAARRRSSASRQRIGAVRGGRPAPVPAGKPEVRHGGRRRHHRRGPGHRVRPVRGRSACRHDRTYLCADDVPGKPPGFDTRLRGRRLPDRSLKTVIMAIAAGKAAAAQHRRAAGFPPQAGLRRRGAAGAPPTTAPPTGACRWPSARRASASATSSTWKCRVSARGSRAGVRPVPALRRVRHRRANRKGAGSMVTITINGQAVEAPEGTSVLDAATGGWCDHPHAVLPEGLELHRLVPRVFGGRGRRGACGLLQHRRARGHAWCAPTRRR